MANTSNKNPVNLKSWEEAVQWLREQPEQSELVIAAYYDDPVIDAADRYWKSLEWKEISKFLPTRSGAALDIGAGRGIASFALAKEGYKVTALEPDPSALVGAESIRSLATETGLSIKTVEEFSETLPFRDNSFDLVFARAVLHHTTDLAKACKEFYRVLKPGGTFIAAREHVISKHEDIEEFFDIHPLHKVYGGENAFLLKEYKTAIENANFRICSVLSPLGSAINYAPYTPEALKSEIAFRIVKNNHFLTNSVNMVLSNKYAWAIMRRLLDAIDNRPGRLYSFVAEKP